MITPTGEQSAIGRQKAQVQRAAWQANTSLKTDYLEDPHWVELASARGMKLPEKYQPCTSGSIERWLHKLGLNGRDFIAWSGGSMAVWMAKNPTWSLRALVGVLLESVEA